jgi:hypothetical protein
MVSDAFLGNTDRLIGGNVNLGNFFYEAAALLAPGVTRTIDNESRFGASSTETGRSGTKRVSDALSGRIDYLKALMTPDGRDIQIGLFFAKFRQVQRLNLGAIAVLQSDEARIRAAINTGITSSMKQMADLFAENPALLRAVSVGDPESAATRNYSTAKAAAKFTRELQVMDPATATERLVAYVEYRAKQDWTPMGFKWVTKLMSGPA